MLKRIILSGDRVLCVPDCFISREQDAALELSRILSDQCCTDGLLCSWDFERTVVCKARTHVLLRSQAQCMSKLHPIHLLYVCEYACAGSKATYHLKISYADYCSVLYITQVTTADNTAAECNALYAECSIVVIPSIAAQDPPAVVTSGSPV